MPEPTTPAGDDRPGRQLTAVQAVLVGVPGAYVLSGSLAVTAIAAAAAVALAAFLTRR